MHVKGLLLEVECEMLRALAAEGVGAAATAWEGLPEADRRILDGALPAMRWFPGALHERLASALDAAAGGDLRRRAAGGRRAAERLLADAEQRGLVSWVAGQRGWSRAGPLLVAIPSRLLSETSWRLTPGDESGRFCVEVSGAEALSDATRRGAASLLEGLATRLAGVPVAVRSERPRPDRLRFLGRPLRAA